MAGGIGLAGTDASDSAGDVPGIGVGMLGYASFEDGYRAAEICDAILRSAATGSREQIIYRGG